MRTLTLLLLSFLLNPAAIATTTLCEALTGLRLGMERQPHYWASLFGPELPYESFRTYFGLFVGAGRGEPVSEERLYALNANWSPQTIRRYTALAMRHGWILKTGRGAASLYVPAPKLIRAYVEFIYGSDALIHDLARVRTAMRSNR